MEIIKKSTTDEKDTFDQSLTRFDTNHQDIDLDSGFSCVSLKDAQNEVFYIDEKVEKALVKKLDWHILPLFCLFYFADFLDRANIGNAT